MMTKRGWTCGVRRLLVALAGAAGLAGVATAAETVVPTPPLFEPLEFTEVAARSVPAFPAPMWTSYALTDALFWGRDNQASGRPLVTTVNDGTPLLTARDAQFPFSEGVRAFYGQRKPCEHGWELGYFGVWGQAASATVGEIGGQQFLQYPDPIGEALTADGEVASLRYTSVINSAEANVFRTWTEWRTPTGAWRTVDWLLGFRYVGVEESAAMDVLCCIEETGAFRNVSYQARTRNNMFGAQVGNRTRWTWERWAVEGWAKAGILGNAQEQIQLPLIDYTGFEQRPALSTTGGVVSFIGDVNLSAVYRLTEVWGIRAGYNLIWIDGLALAPNQLDFANATGAGTGLVSGGGIFMHGANLGLEARW
jgi:hypothetical protein